MDFLKKKMKELMDDDDKKPTDSHGSSGHGDGHDTRGYDQSHGYPPQQQAYPPQHQGYPPQGQSQGYYGSPAPPQGPPAPYGAPPPMPPGWIQQWDQNSQRWYYIEQATGRSQWDPPAQSPAPAGPYAPPPGPPGAAPYTGPYAAAGHDERGLFGNTHGGHDQHGYPPQGYHDPYGHGDHKEKEKKGHSTAMLAAAGVGGVAAGAWIGHELTEDSDEEKHQASYAAAPAAAPVAAPPPAEPYDDSNFQEPPPVPTHDADGDSISSSERSSLESQREEAIEAQEEYQEDLEEAYDD